MADVARGHPGSSATTSLAGRLVGGAVAGLAGGAAFGVLMAAMGMLPMVATLVQSESTLVGLIVHLVISAIIGAAFGLAFGGLAQTTRDSLIWGAVYGVIWWVLGPLLIMPTLMGMGPQFGMALAPPMLMSLLGHVIYGVILGLAYPYARRRFG